MQHYDSKKTIFFKLATLLVAVCVLTLSAAAQVSTGTILGNVTDQAGNSVAGATVTITNLATNIKSETVTGAGGLFTVPNLPPGEYEVSVAAKGFGSEVASGVTLDVGAQRSVNFLLKVGSVSQSVVVTGAAPTVDLATSTIMPVVNEHTIVELPPEYSDTNGNIFSTAE